MNESALKELGLTCDQIEQVKAIRAANQAIDLNKILQAFVAIMSILIQIFGPTPPSPAPPPPTTGA